MRPIRATLSRRRLAILLLAATMLLAPACGAEGLPGLPGLGTVTLINQTDLGMAPLTVQQFFMGLEGEPIPPTNLLAQELAPGGIVIVGLFPAGRYQAVAVLDTGSNINFPVMEVRAGEPTTFVVPAP